MDDPIEYYDERNKLDKGREILYDITYMWNLKNDTNESIYKTEKDSQRQKTKLRLPNGKGVGRDKLGAWG